MKPGLTHLAFLFFIISACNNTPIVNTVSTKETFPGYEHGQNVFNEYCSKCHFEPGKVVSDPPLFSNVLMQMPQPSDKYFVKYLQDSKAVERSGDSFAIRLDRAFDFKFDHKYKDSLTQQDFDSLLLYFRVIYAFKHLPKW